MGIKIRLLRDFIQSSSIGSQIFGLNKWIWFNEATKNKYFTYTLLCKRSTKNNRLDSECTDAHSPATSAIELTRSLTVDDFVFGHDLLYATNKINCPLCGRMSNLFLYIRLKKKVILNVLQKYFATS